MQIRNAILINLLLFTFLFNVFSVFAYIHQIQSYNSIEYAPNYSSTNPSNEISKVSIESSVPENGILDENYNRIDDSLEIIMRYSADPIRVIAIFNDSANFFRFEDYLSTHGIFVFTQGCWPVPYYSFNATASQITEISQIFDGLIGIKEDVESKSNMVESLTRVGVFPSIHLDYGLKGDPNMSVAVLDRGVDVSHPALAGSVVYWKDFTANNYLTPTDPVGHGTAVSSLIVGRPFNTTDGLGRQIVSNVENMDWNNSFIELNKEYIWLTGGYNISVEGEISYTASWARKDGITGVEILKYCIITENGTYLANVSTPLQNTNYTVSFNLGQEHLGIIKVGYIFRRVSSSTYSSYILHSETRIPFNYGSQHTNFTGVAPNANLVALRVIYESEIVNAINWLINNSKTYNITVACMSFGIDSMLVHNAVRGLINSGVVVVAAAGNEVGSTNLAGSLKNTPGSVAEAISVGATTNNNSLTSYSANGGLSISGNTTKPDLVAPGGEFSYKYGSTYPLLLPDTNYGDFVDEKFQTINNPTIYDLVPDRYPNDLSFYSGTSFSAPIVAGTALLMIESIGGVQKWQYTKQQVLELKARLLMTAAETAQSRLFYPSMSPTIDRGAKDVHEGYGLLNAQAACDTYRNKIFPNSTHFGKLTSPRSYQFNVSNVWAAQMNFSSNKYYDVSLSTNDSADFDIYIYESQGNQFGDPILLDKKATVGLGINETFRFNVDVNTTAIITIKCLNGTGQFRLDIIESPDYDAPHSIAIATDLSGKFFSQVLRIQPIGIDQGTGIRRFELYGKPNNSASPYQLIYSFNKTQTVEIPIRNLSDGYYQIYLRAIDGAGNVNTSDIRFVAIDNTPPIVVRFIEPNDYYLRAYGDFYLVIEAKDGFSGIQTVFILDYRTRAVFSSSTKEEGPYVFLWQSRLKDDGDWYIIGSAVDKAGNYKDTDYGLTILIVNRLEQQRTLINYLSFGVVSSVLLYFVSKHIIMHVNLDDLINYFKQVPSKLHSIANSTNKGKRNAL